MDLDLYKPDVQPAEISSTLQSKQLKTFTMKIILCLFLLGLMAMAMAQTDDGAATTEPVDRAVEENLMEVEVEDPVNTSRRICSWFKVLVNKHRTCRAFCRAYGFHAGFCDADGICRCVRKRK